MCMCAWCMARAWCARTASKARSSLCIEASSRCISSDEIEGEINARWGTLQTALQTAAAAPPPFTSAGQGSGVRRAGWWSSPHELAVDPEPQLAPPPPGERHGGGAHPACGSCSCGLARSVAARGGE